MTMKEDVLRDYQKPKDSAQNTLQMKQALLLLKKIHPFYSRFLAHYETLYRYLQNAASTMGTLTQRFFEDNDAFQWGAWPQNAAVDTRKQAGRQSTALTEASSRSCHVTKRFRILDTLKQGNKSMYGNTSGYVHMGVRLDWGKGITGQ